jgi:hypothetical protein
MTSGRSILQDSSLIESLSSACFCERREPGSTHAQVRSTSPRAKHVVRLLYLAEARLESWPTFGCCLTTHTLLCGRLQAVRRTPHQFGNRQGHR